MGGWKVWLSQSGTEAIKRYATEKEQVEDEAERDEAALRTMISADDGGDVSRIRFRMISLVEFVVSSAVLCLFLARY